ncbi:MAG: hypothetical protein H8D56_03355 [Planctomycetes bacterium]|nr:hypothetical protein [Planctomycetota bacterium]MBL7143170.1 hypothetical protein [Phycisphaerae bacterium]
MTQEMQNTMSSSSRQDVFNLPVNTDLMFTNHKNIYKQSIEKRQRKLLQKISFIRPFLHENETILCVTTGCSPASLIEQFLTGWIIYSLKRSLFIFTNERVFHIPTKYDISYRNSIAQILYADCRSIIIKGRNLVAEYKNGKKEKFFYLAENKKIKSMLQQMPLEGQTSPTLERTHLCPRCTNTLIKDQYICPTCSLDFKNKEQTRRISVIYPGGGYFYTGHPLLGIADAITETYLMVLVITASIAAISGIAENIPVVVLLGIILALEKVLTVYHSNHFIKEFIPKDRSIEMLTTIPEGQSPEQVAPEPKPEEILSASWRSS